MENNYEDNVNIEPDPIEDPITDTDFDEDDRMDHDFPGRDSDFIEDQDDRDDFPESLEWEAIEGEQETGYGNDMDGFDFPEFDG